MLARAAFVVIALGLAVPALAQDRMPPILPASLTDAQSEFAIIITARQ